MNNYFKQAEFALAAYSHLNSAMSLSEYLEALKDDGKGLSPSQANTFANTYRVICKERDLI